MGYHICKDFCPPGWTDDWRKWHIGHGCNLDPDNTEACRECRAQLPKHADTCPVPLATERAAHAATRMQLEALQKAAADVLDVEPWENGESPTAADLRVWITAIAALRDALEHAPVTKNAKVLREAFVAALDYADRAHCEKGRQKAYVVLMWLAGFAEMPTTDAEAFIARIFDKELALAMALQRAAPEKPDVDDE